MANVRFEHVYKRFLGGVVAVSDFNLEINDKEFIVFVGPSGCGKTTSLRMAAGLEDISEGNIYIGDTLVNDVLPKDRDIAMVFQNYALYPHMDVYNNLAFGLKMRQVPKPEIDRRVKETARILGIEAFLKRRPKALSGGQRQRVALGRAIIREPKVFLMDEPLSNLDAKLRVQTRAELAKLHKRLQTTTIYVTHDQIEAMTMGDRLVVMKDGLIQQVGTPLEIYDHPNNVFVAGFIGTPPMNFLQGVVREVDGQLVFHSGVIEVNLPQTKLPQFRAYINQAVILGIRPEDIYDQASAPKLAASQVFNATIDLAELIGSETYLYVSVGEQALVARVDSHSKAKAGVAHQFVFNLDKLHLFDKATERTIL